MDFNGKLNAIWWAQTEDFSAFKAIQLEFLNGKGEKMKSKELCFDTVKTKEWHRDNIDHRYKIHKVLIKVVVKTDLPKRNKKKLKDEDVEFPSESVGAARKRVSGLAFENENGFRFFQREFFSGGRWIERPLEKRH